MAEYKAFSPEAEVVSAGVRAIMDATELMRPKALRILADHGIDPAMPPDVWYPQQRLLSALRTIFHSVGPATLRAIGRRVPGGVPFPAEPRSLPEALAAIDAAYRLNHRSPGPLGTYLARPVGEREVRMECENPYPCEFDHGLIEGVCDRFRPADGTRVLVTHEPGPCRTQGADRCDYRVAW